MLNVGQRIEDFTIERELGRGGMGIVYSAVNEKTAERVAIKVLAPHLLPDPRQRRRFQREAYAAIKIEHDGLVRVLNHGEHEQAEPYIIMEYLDGASLRQALQAAPDQRFSIEAAIQVATQLADVLSSAHKSGLLHRDIKPSNVMLLGPMHQPERCRVKLLDFGLARLLTEGEGSTISEGDVIGTPAYMSPEQCEGRADLDGRSDVYGLGALLFEMLCGRTPFVGPPPRMMYQHVYESPPAPERFRPEISSELSALIVKMLAKTTGSRPTMAETAAQLRAQSKSIKVPPPAPIRMDAPRISDKARLWIGVLALINVALAVSLWRAIGHGTAAREIPVQAREAVSPPPLVVAPRGPADHSSVSAPAPPPASPPAPADNAPMPAPSPSLGAAPAPDPVSGVPLRAAAFPQPKSFKKNPGPAPGKSTSVVAPHRLAAPPPPARPAMIVQPPPSTREESDDKPPPADAAPSIPPAAPQPAPAPTRQKVEYWN